MPKRKSSKKSSEKVKVVNVTTSKQAEEISKKLKNGKPACVIYLMEGCPHCVTLKETLHHEVEPVLKNRMGNMIVKIHSDLMDHLNIENKNVEGFPTITVVKHGKQTREHSGERNLDALLEFLANSNVIDDVAMAGGAKRKTRKLRKRKTLTKKVRPCCRSCKTCSKCSCKCKKPCKSCKCKCKCKSRKSRKQKGSGNDPFKKCRKILDNAKKEYNNQKSNFSIVSTEPIITKYITKDKHKTFFNENNCLVTLNPNPQNDVNWWQL